MQPGAGAWRAVRREAKSEIVTVFASGRGANAPTSQFRLQDASPIEVATLNLTPGYCSCGATHCSWRQVLRSTFMIDPEMSPEITIISLCHVWGGTACHTVALANHLAERAHVRIVHIGGSDLLEKSPFLRRLDCRVQVIPITLHGHNSSLSAMIRVLARYVTRTCIVQKGAFGAGSTSLLIALRLLVRKLIVIVHSAFVDPLPPKTSRRYLWGTVAGPGMWWHRRRLREFWLPACLPSVTVCVSNAVKSAIEHAGKICLPRCQIVHNGVDPGRFQFSPANRDAVRDAWGFDDSMFVFGYVGRLGAEKGCSRLLGGFAQYVMGTGDRLARLVFVGDGPEMKAITLATAGYGLEGVVRMIGAVDDVAAIYSALDCFVLVSDVEGLPLSLLEAMAAGCLCVARDVGGVTEALTDREGIIVPREGETEMVAAALRQARMLGHEQRTVLQRNCREKVEARFNIFQQMEQLARIVL